MFVPKKVLLSAAVALALAACGGGGSDPAPELSSTTSGKAIDGYLSGSTVFCDANANGTQDTGETSATTDADGDFTLATACTSTIVVTGGTNIDTGFPFTGVLKAKAGAAVITPLTTLLTSSSLTNAQLVAALGLPAGTDIARVDPIAQNNLQLLKATVAAHQIIQRLADAFATTGSNSVAEMYSTAAAAFASVMATAGSDAPLIKSDGTVDLAVLTPVAAKLATELNVTLSSTNAAAIAEQLAAQVQNVLAAPDASVLKDVVTIVQNPQASVIDISASANYLSLEGNAFEVNDTVVTLAGLEQGATVTGLQQVSLDLNVAGTLAIDKEVDVALEVVEVGGQQRKLQLLLEGVKVKVGTSQPLSITASETAKLHVFGVTSNGVEVKRTLTNVDFAPIATTDNVVTLSYTNMVNKAIDSEEAIANFLDVKGQFTITMAVSDLNVRKTDGTALGVQTVTVPSGTTFKSVSGYGLKGTLTIN